jgi:hypothetical protein
MSTEFLRYYYERSGGRHTYDPTCSLPYLDHPTCSLPYLRHTYDPTCSLPYLDLS